MQAQRVDEVRQRLVFVRGQQRGDGIRTGAAGAGGRGRFGKQTGEKVVRAGGARPVGVDGARGGEEGREERGKGVDVAGLRRLSEGTEAGTSSAQLPARHGVEDQTSSALKTSVAACSPERAPSQSSAAGSLGRTKR